MALSAPLRLNRGLSMRSSGSSMIRSRADLVDHAIDRGLRAVVVAAQLVDRRAAAVRLVHVVLLRLGQRAAERGEDGLGRIFHVVLLERGADRLHAAAGALGQPAGNLAPARRRWQLARGHGR